MQATSSRCRNADNLNSLIPSKDTISAMKKFDAYKSYLFIETASSLFYSLAFTAMSLYEIRVAGLSPLQLVLVGTTLELSVLLCEVPTGVVADVYSRRLSILIGFGLIGLGFLLEGLVPFFATILLAQVLWGLGYTFTSGATQAWLSDEIGEERANRAFLRANKFSLAGSLAGMLLAILIGSRQVNLPILVSGGLFILLAGVLCPGHARDRLSPGARWNSAIPSSRCSGLSALACRPCASARAW